MNDQARGGSVALVLTLAVLLVGAAVAVALLDRETATPLVLALLALLAVVGVFALFGAAVGLLQVASRRPRDEVARGIIEGTPDGLIVVNAAGRVLFANDAYAETTGAGSVDDVKPVELVFSSDPDVAEAIYRLAQAARAGRVAQEEIRLSHGPRGQPAWLKIRVRPLDPTGAQRDPTVWVVGDVTRERERHENVFQELQHAVDFLDHAPAGFFSAEPDGAISYMNATLAGWLDHDLAVVSGGGLRLSEILAGDGAALVAALAPTPGRVRLEAFDVDLKTRTGQSRPVRLLHKVAFSSEGAASASRTLVLDRSSSAAAIDESARAAEVRFARFFNDTPIAIATIDAEGSVLTTNAAFAKLFGEQLKAAGDRAKIVDLITERDRPFMTEVLAQARAGRGDVPSVDLALAGGGSAFARFFMSAVDRAEGDAEAAIVYALDTTEQRALEAKFAQSQKMNAVGQLAGGVAHDFNNVLTAIIGYSDLLLTNHRPTDPSFQDIMQIKQNANRAAGLVRQLLAFSRRQTLRPQVLQLNDAIAELRNMLSRLLGEKVRLEVVHGRDLWLVKVDLNQFENVVINLSVNARDAMPDGGTLTIRTRNVAARECGDFGEAHLPPADYVMIEVEDTGTGIPAEIREQIFEPFFSTKEVGKGTGLGLSTVYGIVKQTEGFIFVASEVGRGSIFRVFLPRHVPKAAEAAKPSEHHAASADLTGSGTILLVEDEDAVRAFGARALVSRGYTVLEAASGTEALRVLEEHDGTVDLVVSDVVMPEMDGPTLLKELRQRLPAVKVVFVSGYAEEAFKKNLGEDEDFAFLPKPFTLKQLVQTVKEALPGPAVH